MHRARGLASQRVYVDSGGEPVAFAGKFVATFAQRLASTEAVATMQGAGAVLLGRG